MSRQDPPTDTPRWLTFVVVLAATTGASALSFGITITPLAISPVLMVPAVGAALLAWLGQWAWPAVVLGGVLGELLVTSRSLPLVVLLALLHGAVAATGAWWITRHDAWPGDLRSSVRFVAGAVVLSAVSTVVFAGILGATGEAFGTQGFRNDILWAGVGVLVGFMVAGAPLMAWISRTTGGGGGIGAPLGLALVTVASFAGLAGPVGVAAPIALLGMLLLAARAGRQWGSLALIVVAATAFTGAERGMNPVGGMGTAGAMANVMVTLALFGGFVVLLGGYRTAGASRTQSAATTALVFAGLMLVAGVAGVVSNDVVVTEDSPLVIAGIFTAVSSIGLFILRSARPVDRPPRRTGIGLAALAGAFYALNLGLLFAAMPLIGPGSATALAMISPLPVVVLSVIFLRLRPSWAVLGAIGIIVAGAIVAALESLSSPRGVVLALTSAVAFAGSVVCTRKALGQAGIIDVALASAVSAAVIALAAGAMIDGPSALLVSQGEIRVIALAALGAQLIPILGRTWALEHMGADLVGAEGVLAPASTALLSFWLLTPPTAASQWVGLLVIAAGAVLAALVGGRTSSPRAQSAR